ncbi:MAG: aldo/keto reductase [Candidatus Rokuibacteriota bacterium]
MRATDTAGVGTTGLRVSRLGLGGVALSGAPPATDPHQPYCVEHGIGVVAGGPYNSGLLAVGPRAGATFNYRAATPEMMDKAARIESVCDRHHVPLKAAALQFILAHAAIVSVIPGGAVDRRGGGERPHGGMAHSGRSMGGAETDWTDRRLGAGTVRLGSGRDPCMILAS